MRCPGFLESHGPLSLRNPIRSGYSRIPGCISSVPALFFWVFQPKLSTDCFGWILSSCFDQILWSFVFRKDRTWPGFAFNPPVPGAGSFPTEGHGFIGMRGLDASQQNKATKHFPAAPAEAESRPDGGRIKPSRSIQRQPLSGSAPPAASLFFTHGNSFSFHASEEFRPRCSVLPLLLFFPGVPIPAGSHQSRGWNIRVLRVSSRALSFKANPRGFEGPKRSLRRFRCRDSRVGARESMGTSSLARAGCGEGFGIA